MRRFAIIGALALLVISGCKKGPSFVGKWTTELQGMGQQTVSLNEDKSAEANAKVTQGPVTVNFTAKGTWSNTDKEMTITMTDIKVDGLPPNLEALVKPQIEKEKGKPQTGAYTWNGEDEFTMTVGGKAQVFKRVKPGS